MICVHWIWKTTGCDVLSFVNIFLLLGRHVFQAMNDAVRKKVKWKKLKPEFSSQ